MIRTQTLYVWDYNTWIVRTVHREHAFGNQGHVAYSRLLVCPKCHEVWAKLLILEEPYAYAVGASCERCGVSDKMHPVPGSILTEEGFGVIDDSLLDKLPPELVAREFRLHMNHYANAEVIKTPQIDLFGGSDVQHTSMGTAVP